MLRVKSDIRFARKVWESVDEVCRYLGIPKNSFVCLATSKMALEMAAFLPVRNRKKVAAELEIQIAEVLKKIK